MSRIAAGVMIAIAALLMNGAMMRDVLAEDAGTTGMRSSALSSQVSPAVGHRSERVLSLLIALEALRAAPEILDKR
jgi:hypothetical protein